jgi:PAS domain S-box-containing protein
MYFKNSVAASLSPSPRRASLDARSADQESAALPPGSRPRPRNRETGRFVMHLLVSGLLMAALLAGCLWLPHVDHATVALLMLLAVYGLARVWGTAEARTGAILGALGFDYYVLPPAGFHIAKPEYGVALAAFLAAAFVIIQLTERSRRMLAERGGLLNLALEPSGIRDRTGKFRLVNPALEALLGSTAEQLCSRHFLEFVHPDDHLLSEAAFSDLSRHPIVDFENRYQAKDGGWRWLHWRIAPHTDTSEVLTVARDITEQKWAQDKLRDLADQVMTAQEEERRRIARELHDDVTQRLATVGIELGLLRKTEVTGALDLPQNLGRLQAQILQLSEDIRRLSHSLHPSVLEHSDLAAALEAHCREFTQQHSITANFVSRDVPEDIPQPVTLALYRIAQESLQNVARHSRATTASVVLAGEDGAWLSLFIIDNGTGFDVRKAKISPGLGLVSIEERARHIGASVTIDSMTDAGTRLTVQVPRAGD